MAKLMSVAGAISRLMPKTLTPKEHAIADYLTVASFLLAGRLLWRKNKHASLSAFVCGGAELALNLLTDYPGGITDAIPFDTHKNLDLRLAAVSASMPELMGFSRHRARWLFLLEGGGITVLANLTQSTAGNLRYPKARRAA